MAIVNENDKKVVLNYTKTQKVLVSPTDVLKTYLHFFATVKWMGGGVQMSTINIGNHTSVIDSCVPPKFNHHHKERWLASPVIMCHYFMKRSDFMPGSRALET